MQTDPRMTRVVVAVGGSIAAYKACDLVSKLVQTRITVDVVLSREALHFVQPLAFAALTHRPAFTDERLWDDRLAEGGPAKHLRITEQADLFVVAPATANLIGKMAHGIADEIVSTTYLGAGCPILIAPAMNHRMWASPRVQANLEVLRGDGVEVIGPVTGWLAEGEHGMGRMEEPELIRAAIATRLLERKATGPGT